MTALQQFAKIMITVALLCLAPLIGAYLAR
jgi:hypothetical protein